MSSGRITVAGGVALSQEGKNLVLVLSLLGIEIGQDYFHSRSLCDVHWFNRSEHAVFINRFDRHGITFSGSTSTDTPLPHQQSYTCPAPDTTELVARRVFPPVDAVVIESHLFAAARCPLTNVSVGLRTGVP